MPKLNFSKTPLGPPWFLTSSWQCGWYTLKTGAKICLFFIFWWVQMKEWKTFCHLLPTLKVETVTLISESCLCSISQHWYAVGAKLTCVPWMNKGSTAAILALEQTALRTLNLISFGPVEHGLKITQQICIGIAQRAMDGSLLMELIVWWRSQTLIKWSH